MNFKSVVRFAVILTIAIGLSIMVIHHWLNNKTYLLDDKIVAQIAEKYVGKIVIILTKIICFFCSEVYISVSL